MTKPHFYWYVGLNWRLLFKKTMEYGIGHLEDQELFSLSMT